MPLTSGSRLGLYEVVGALGAGGMGEVYRARDTKLGRAVALKILPDALAFDAERIARFEREAKALAALNHPHIAALYGMEEADGRHFLVMELVEGETLAERLQRGPIPVGEALKTALQIADALEAAHEKGIVHRDLKPANVKITPDEKVKVLDFGLAKAMETERADGSLTHSPTLSMMMTGAGVILGTAAYMSPEQAKGFPADQRSDVFSFGVVLYEMLTGRRPFQGETAPDVLASVLARDPDLTWLPPNLNPRLQELVRRCLEKHPKRRWQAIGDVRAEIETIAADPHGVSAMTQVVAPSRPLWRRGMPIVITAIVAGGLAGIGVWNFRPVTSPPVARVAFSLPEGQVFTNAGRQLVAISRDGTQIVYVASSRLYLRSISELEARPIAGSEGLQGVLNPVFSPDGRSIAFWSAADQTVKKIAITGGVAVTICPADRPYGMHWGQSGIVLGQGTKGILRVSPNGGQPEVLVSVKTGEAAHGAEVLPDEQSVLFTLATGAGADRWDTAQIVVQSLKTAERTILVRGSDARYLPTGHIVYARGGVVFAIPVDLRKLTTRGGSVPMIEGVRRSEGSQTGAAHFSVSDTGSLVYIPGPALGSSAQVDVALIDRKGIVEKLKVPSGSYEVLRISPDGKQLALGIVDDREANIWIYEMSGARSMRRLTSGRRNRFPIWTADGQRIVFQSDREGDLGIFWQRADGSDTAQRLTKPDHGASHIPESWSLTGDLFSFSASSGSDFSLWTLSVHDKKATRFSQVRSALPVGSVFSPDGQWVAYVQYGLGVELWVEPFPSTGAKYLISKGVIHPLWSPDGKALSYTAPGQFSMVSITTRPSFKFSPPVPAPRPFHSFGVTTARSHDIMPDGRFVGVVAPGEGASRATQIHVVLNWFEDLKQRAPAR